MVHAKMIDLHSHTTESDGTFSPRQLVDEAVHVGLEALAITDHDTFTGFDQAAPYAAGTSVELIRGIELSTKYHGRSIHLLGYFFNPPAPEFGAFCEWVGQITASRRDRNQALIDCLRAHGIAITLQEVERHAGRIVARPHFAAVLMEKGYVTSIDEAFAKYLDESAMCYISRESPEFDDSVARILAAGGVAVLPHPGRARGGAKILENEAAEMQRMGLRGIEVYHSDHDAADVAFYLAIAKKLGLAITGGSDFHGAAKPNIQLGTGIDGNLHIPKSLLDHLRELK
jgi:predicted metal-dependent phosphoesterase TrpH